MTMSTQTIKRKHILPVILLFSIISGILRIYFYPSWNLYGLHIIFFILLFLVLMAQWEMVVITGKLLYRYFPTDNWAVTKVIVQIFISFLIAAVIQFSVFTPIEYFSNVKRTVPTVEIITPIFIFFRVLVFNLIYFGNHYFEEWKKNLMRSEGLQREQVEVRYQALKNQLNPHFLFNALTSLNSLIFENQQLASDFLKQLSKVYRYTLQNKENQTVSLEKEIAFIDHYIFLMKTRFGSAILFQTEIDDSEKDKGIVPVTTQMLIENAVKHNSVLPSSPLSISITAKNGYLIVSNSLNRRKQVETSNKQGLDGLRSLYSYLTTQPIEIEETENKFTVKIPLI